VLAKNRNLIGIVYRVSKQTVYIYLITDGRRDMEALLRRRLLDK
jgi:hypothetical protein